MIAEAAVRRGPSDADLRPDSIASVPAGVLARLDEGATGAILFPQGRWKKKKI